MSLLANIRWQVALNLIYIDLYRGIYFLKKPLCGYFEHVPEIATEIGFAYIARPRHLLQYCTYRGYGVGII